MVGVSSSFHQMINRAGIFQSQLPGHETDLTIRRVRVSIRTAPFRIDALTYRIKLLGYYSVVSQGIFPCFRIFKYHNAVATGAAGANGHPIYQV